MKNITNTSKASNATNATKQDKPAEDQLALNLDQNMMVSAESQSMEKMLESAKFNSHMN